MWPILGCIGWFSPNPIGENCNKIKICFDVYKSWSRTVCWCIISYELTKKPKKSLLNAPLVIADSKGVIVASPPLEGNFCQGHNISTTAGILACDTSTESCWWVHLVGIGVGMKKTRGGSDWVWKYAFLLLFEPFRWVKDKGSEIGWYGGREG